MTAVPPTPMPVPAAGPLIESGTTHDPAQQSRLLRDALETEKVPIGCFIGAGCPLGIYDEKGERSLGLIPDVGGLTKTVQSTLRDRCGKEASDPKALDPKFAACWAKLAQDCTDDGIASPNVEHLLTELRNHAARRGTFSVEGLDKSGLRKLDGAVCDLIAEVVGKPLPPHWTAYHRFASWVGGIARTTPVEVFTPNYDLLVEQALEGLHVPHFDGFVGSREPFFDLSSIEHDIIPPRWTRLWKLHGSINWQVRPDGTVFRVHGQADSGQAMIYMSHLKYDQSRKMPYLAMMDRLRSFFWPTRHPQGHAPPRLVVCGYSFADEHLNEVLLDGLRGNAAAQCFALAFERLAGSTSAVDFAERQPNLTLLCLDGAVIGTRKGAYKLASSGATPDDPWLAKEPIAAADGRPAQGRALCRLGDFHYFALFLERLYAGRSEPRNAALSV